MARRKRASMREGPLADLFRSTTDPDREQEPAPQAGDREEETRVMEGEPARSEPPPPSREPTRERATPAPPPDPERVRAYRIEDEAPPPVLPAKERLSRIFADEGRDPEGPSYGREE